MEIELLTQHPEARTNTFKITIKPSDYDKAMNPDVWPYRVGVRLFRQKRAQILGIIRPDRLAGISVPMGVFLMEATATMITSMSIAKTAVTLSNRPGVSQWKLAIILQF